MGEFPNKDSQFKPGQSGNPQGPKPGYKHISTWIQDMLNDDKFETVLTDASKGYIQYKGAPLKAIIQVAIHKSIHDKEKGQAWAEWLAKHGYGTKITIQTEDPIEALLKNYNLVGDNDGRQADEAVSGPPEGTA